jgi:1-deoxy-D-xylulose-5-phosphate reductoisomerase
LELSARLKTKGIAAEVAAGPSGLLEAASIESASMTLNSIVGVRGLEPTLAALESGKSVALANKETLVAAGGLVMETARRKGLDVVPVDSEHSAVFQCLQSSAGNPPRRIFLTASGGPFRLKTKEEAYNAPLAEALAHPSWSMGPKISVDSATMMNKGLEVIEAKWLFSLEEDQIEVLVHPGSVVHSMVEFQDGAVLAQLGLADMRLPIQYALTHPKRLPCPVERIDFLKCGPLQFFPPDVERFPCLALARSALREGGLAPAVLNGANEAAVAAYLAGRIPFGRIPEIIEIVMSSYTCKGDLSLEGVLEADRGARAAAGRLALA